MSNDSKVIVIIDSEDEEPVEIKKSNSEMIIVIDDDDKQPSKDVNKMFQKDTRLSNLNRHAKLKKPLISKIRQSQFTNIKKETIKNIIYSSSTIANQVMSIEKQKSINQKDSPIVTCNRSTKRRYSNQKSEHSPFKKPSFECLEKAKDVEQIDDTETDLAYYISYVTNRNVKHIDENDVLERPTKASNMQCPICYLLFPKTELIEHASECDGKKVEKGLYKKSIAKAVARDEQERKRRNIGIQETKPTNYYLDSDVLATDGTGFNTEITGLNWESAGQTRFA